MSETNETSSSDSEATPDGVARHDPDETMSRAAVQKLVKQRDGLKQALAEREQEVEQLRAKSKPGQPPEKPKAGEMPEWASALVSKLGDEIGALRSEFAERDNTMRERARTGALEQILGQVPESNRADARTMIAGLEATKAIDLTSPTAVADAMARLNTSSVMFDASRGTPRRAPQIGADGKPDLSVFDNMDDVPPDLRGYVYKDKAEFNRLMGGSTGDGGAVHNI